MKKFYWTGDGHFILVEIVGEDDTYWLGYFYCSQPKVIPAGIIASMNKKLGCNYYDTKIRKDDLNLLSIYPYEPYKQGWYKEWRVFVSANIGNRFWCVGIRVLSPKSIGNILIEQTFVNDDYYTEEGSCRGYISCDDKELIVDPDKKDGSFFVPLDISTKQQRLYRCYKCSPKDRLGAVVSCPVYILETTERYFLVIVRTDLDERPFGSLNGAPYVDMENVRFWKGYVFHDAPDLL